MVEMLSRPGANNDNACLIVGGRGCRICGFCAFRVRVVGICTFLISIESLGRYWYDARGTTLFCLLAALILDVSASEDTIRLNVCSAEKSGSVAKPLDCRYRSESFKMPPHSYRKSRRVHNSTELRWGPRVNVEWTKCADNRLSFPAFTEGGFALALAVASHSGRSRCVNELRESLELPALPPG
jgi:hypothetical protein